MNSVLDFRLIGKRAVLDGLKSISYSQKERRRVLRNVAAQVKKKAVQNYKQNKNFDGSAMQKRAKQKFSKQIRRKMFRKLHVGLSTKERQTGSFSISWHNKNKMHAYIATKHHEGMTFQNYNNELKNDSRNNSAESKDKPATYYQVMRLFSFGFQRPVKKGSYKRMKLASKSYIKKNINRGQAGVLIRALKEKQGIPRGQDKTTLPARPALGVTNTDLEKFLIYAIDTKIKNFKTRKRSK